ncbi:MAG: penicillin-binding transpeptidase domain-containing protein [Kiritimatiellia bacterium]
MKSSNIATAKIATEKLGAARLEDYMKRFGMGRKTGIELPDEEAGIFHPRSKWSQLSLSRLPIGQGIAVTALQMVGAVNTVANGGVYMKPTLLKRVTDADGNLLHEFTPQALGRPISPKVAATMQWMMARVCSKEGTARRAMLDQYPAGGKTGTAQKPVRGGYSSTDYIASFAGFVPADDPEFTCWSPSTRPARSTRAAWWRRPCSSRSPRRPSAAHPRPQPRNHRPLSHPARLNDSPP